MEQDSKLVDLVLESLREMRSDIKTLTSAVSELEAKIVGQDRCDDLRKEGTQQCRTVNAKYNARLQKVEEICFGLNAVKDKSVDGEELEIAKKEVLSEAEKKIDNFDTRIRKLEAKDQLATLTWNIVWGNPVLKTLILGGGYISSVAVVGVYWGRIGQYGWHMVAVILGAFILLALFLNRGATKNAARKVMGWT
jgi:BMFP domain-containing protein YqiC